MAAAANAAISDNKKRGREDKEDDSENFYIPKKRNFGSRGRRGGRRGGHGGGGRSLQVLKQKKKNPFLTSVMSKLICRCHCYWVFVNVFPI